MIRILIVAAYVAVRAGLRALLADAPDLSIVGEASGSAELERVLPSSSPDVVLLDWDQDDGLLVLDVLGGSEGEIGVVVLGTGRGDYQTLASRPIHGWAYLLKEAEGAEIAGAVRAVATGLIVMDASFAPMLAVGAPVLPEGRAAATITTGSDEALTAREHQVLQLMAQGLPNKQIATRLTITQHTVKFHVASILAKLGATSRTEAVTLGARRGYVIF